MLQDYPPEIQNLVPPKTIQEKRATYVYGLPFMLTLISYPVISSIILRSTHHWNFLQILKYARGVALYGNLFDLVICDWLVFCYLTPPFLIIPGTENARGYKNYYFHFKAFLKGLIFVMATALLSAGVATLFGEA